MELGVITSISIDCLNKLVWGCVYLLSNESSTNNEDILLETTTVEEIIEKETQ